LNSGIYILARMVLLSHTPSLFALVNFWIQTTVLLTMPPTGLELQTCLATTFCPSWPPAHHFPRSWDYRHEPDCFLKTSFFLSIPMATTTVHQVGIMSFLHHQFWPGLSAPYVSPSNLSTHSSLNFLNDTHSREVEDIIKGPRGKWTEEWEWDQASVG
jgi:hypothetical protein